MKHILIIDSNLGFLFWLGEALAEARHQAWPACNVAEAGAILRSRRLPRLDLLIVNPSVDGALRLVQRLRRARPDLKVLAVDPVNDEQVRGISDWRVRPQSHDRSAKSQWLRHIERVIHVHKRAA
ncbi:MAG TPA: hypothetical protein VMB03_24820 [Bryobacteraceae bacterium]|nr:hypothetical protein [Bryobacteraceae bacterium]